MNFVYPNLNSTPPPPPEYFLNRMILAPRNSDVDAVNETLLDNMTGDVKIFYSADQVIQESGTDNHHQLLLTPEFLRSVKSTSLPPGELRIKIGCPLILMRNLSPSNGLCNGSRMIVVGISDRVLQVRLIGGEHNDELALIPRITLFPSSMSTFTFKLRRHQFSVHLAFALTINRAQGQSVTYLGLDLRISVFAHGQLYVAFSRVIARQNIKVLLPNGNLHSKTNNIVYEEALLH